LPRTATSNNGGAALAYNRPFTKSLVFVSQTSYAKDVVQEVNYRFVTLDGVGFVPILKKKISLTLVPGLGAFDTDYEFTGVLVPLAALFANVERRAVGYGVYDHLTVAIMPTLVFNQTLMHFRSFQNSSVYLLQSQFSLVGYVAPKVGISISVVSNYDSQLPEPYIAKQNTTLTTGLQFKF
jgi:hypothetical protein